MDEIKDIHLKPDAIRLLNYMRTHNGITGREAVVNCGVCDYRKRISEMRQAGIPITDEWESGPDRRGETRRYKRYRYDGGPA